ncbi:hypothetical protein Tco_1499133 [Tanacetum coccineum]
MSLLSFSQNFTSIKAPMLSLQRTFSQDLDLLEQHLTKEIISQTDCKTTLTKLRTTFENAFNSEIKARMQNYTRYDAQSFYDAMIFNMDSLEKCMLELILYQQRTPQLLKQKKLMQTQEDHSHPIPALNVDSLKVDLVVIQNTCSEKEDSNSETASSKLVKECSLNSETKDVHAIKYKMSKAKERCMAYFRSLHSHLQVLSKDDLKGTRIEHGFKRAFMSLFGQDVDTFTSTMLLNVDQLQKQLDKDEFQEDGSMTAFWVVNNQFQKFINSIQSLHWIMIQKSVAERTLKSKKTEYVKKESIRTDSTVQDDSSKSGNDTDADDADIRPIYDEEPMAEVQLTAECNIFAIGQQHTEQPEIIVEGRVDQYPETCQVKSPMLDSSPDNQTTEYSKQSLESENILLKETVARISKRLYSEWKHIAFNKAKIEKEFDVLETMNIELEHSVATLRKENETLKQHYKDLWKPTGKIFTSVGLRWIPTGKLFESCISKVDSEPPHGSNVDIPNIHACKQTLDVSAGTSINVQKEQSLIFNVQRYLFEGQQGKSKSMVAEKDDISETIVKVDSQMMIQTNDVCSQQFRPRSSMSNDV